MSADTDNNPRPSGPTSRPPEGRGTAGLRWLRRSRLTGYAALLAVLLLVPAVFTRVPFFTLSVAVLMGLQAIAALGLVPLTGHGGQISLGQAAFYAVGGYTSAILTLRWHVNAAFAMAAGMLLAAALAYLVGSFIFRAQGHYLALATLSFGLVAASLANQLPVTGATAGLSGIPPLTPFGRRLDGDLPLYYLVALALLASVVVVDRLLRSPYGKALTALGDSPVATAAAGISIAGLRRGAFALAAALAALAGSLYAHWSTYMDSTQAGVLPSVQLLIVASVGGLRTVWGAPVGAFVLVSFSQAARSLIPKLVPGAASHYEIVVYGIALIVVLLFLPQGVAGGARMLAERGLRAVRATRGRGREADAMR